MGLRLQSQRPPGPRERDQCDHCGRAGGGTVAAVTAPEECCVHAMHCMKGRSLAVQAHYLFWLSTRQWLENATSELLNYQKLLE